jgi:hypothetical protein
LKQFTPILRDSTLLGQIKSSSESRKSESPEPRVYHKLEQEESQKINPKPSGLPGDIEEEFLNAARTGDLVTINFLISAGITLDCKSVKLKYLFSLFLLNFQNWLRRKE